MFILDDISSVCNDVGLAFLLQKVQTIFDIICIIVPIILIVALIIVFIRFLFNPDPKNGGPQNGGPQNIVTKVILAVAIFFLPLVVDLVMGLLQYAVSSSGETSDTFSVISCWNTADKQSVYILTVGGGSENGSGGNSGMMGDLSGLYAYAEK